MMNEKINLIFLGIFPYPHGMAGTKRIQHAINALKGSRDVSMRVLVLYQPLNTAALTGTYEGTSYQTLMADCSGAKRIALYPALYIKTIRTLRQAWRSGCKNIIYNYGPMTPDNFVTLQYCRHRGYKIVFDIVEDYDVAMDIFSSMLSSINLKCIQRLSTMMIKTASGFIVINSHLEEKYRRLTRGHTPLHYRPISVDMKKFRANGSVKKDEITLFYAGSFGKKDGVSVLLDAFDKLAVKRKNVRLVLSGRGTPEDMQAFFSRMELSPYKDRIEYRGYLGESSYYALLNTVDIPCMTRIDLAYAHAGFPFKLGEFLASGKPVIASRVSDIEEFLADRRNAMLVRPGDSEEIVKAVKYLIDNPEAAKQIGKEGCTVAGSNFDSRTQGKSLLSFLKTI
jgi:glycosyltransferase involved in cell wall biosynthesis